MSPYRRPLIGDYKLSSMISTEITPGGQDLLLRRPLDLCTVVLGLTGCSVLEEVKTSQAPCVCVSSVCVCHVCVCVICVCVCVCCVCVSVCACHVCVSCEA